MMYTDDLLIEAIVGRGVDVRQGSLPKPLGGIYVPETNTIVISTRYKKGTPQYREILIHELGHALTVNDPYITHETVREWAANLFVLEVGPTFYAGEMSNTLHWMRELGVGTMNESMLRHVLSVVRREARLFLRGVGLRQVLCLPAGV